MIPQSEYRIGTLKDLPALQQLALLSFGQFENDLTPENWALMKSNIQNVDKSRELIMMSRVFICCSGSDIIGAAYLIPSGNPTEIFDAEWCYIRMVSVNPQFQGRGIAKELTRLCINYAIELNEQTIALHTSEIMNAARHIYENMGFKVHKELGYRLGIMYWLYTLDISGASK